MAIYIGLDSSTQSLTATAIEIAGSQRAVLFERSLSFDEALPEYGTRHGVIPSEDERIAVAPPLMWADALDRMMALIAGSGIDLSQIKAISGSAQQHGSVYLGPGAAGRLAALDPGAAPAGQLQGIFSRSVSPIWMDSSTAAECRAITDALGGPLALARLTGSRAFERFTGPQIRKFATREPDAYARTARIHLVSSYLASLLAGQDAPLEPADASGMNLMDLATCAWAPAALAATATDLEGKLPAIRESSHVVGPLAPYWQRRHGFPPAKVVVWSGDNPCSVIGVGLVREQSLAISLGTSDTVFGPMREPHIESIDAGTVFRSPADGYVGLTCFRNGSLARERVRDDAGVDWEGVSEILRTTPPGNGGAIMLPWFAPEITPPVPDGGARRYGLDSESGPANVRAVIEGQLMAMAAHTRWIGSRFDSIHATGGGAENREILQVMADVFDADVCRIDQRNSAALGAALRAYHADQKGRISDWGAVVAGFAEPDVAKTVHPVPGHAAVYRRLAPVHAVCERHAQTGEGNPEAAIGAFRRGG